MDHPTVPVNEVSYRRFSDDTVPLSDNDIPLRAENRRQTDKIFIFILIGCIAITVPFVIYTLSYANLGRLHVSHTTTRTEFGSSFEVEVSRTTTRTEIENTFELDKSYVSKVGWRVTLACLISLCITVGVASLFRYATGFVVWGILITTWAYFFVGCIAMWFAPNNSLVLKIVVTLIIIGLLCVLIFMKDRIRLVTMLFKEATKASFDMQMIFLIPLVTVIVLLILASIFVTAFVYMATAGVDTVPTPSDYLPSNFVVAVIIVTVIVAYWVIEFLSGIQYMITSGAVTKWYFTRNKEILGDPVYTSFYITMKYHVGTAALGSLLITLMSVLRALVRSLTQNSRLRLLVDCCMRYIDAFLRFFTKNAYIVTAMHGTSFVQSGKQAAKLLTLNICNTITISSIGEFVIGMACVLVLGVSALLTYLLMGDANNSQNAVFCYLVVVGVALLCCFTILGTFENAFSTLFLCVCQDFVLNNGSDKPYAMTRNLMEFLEASKKVFEKKIQKKGLPTI